MMPDRFGVVGLAALDQFGDLPPQDVGNRAAIAADRIGIADAFGPVGIADAARYQFEGGDLAMRAVGEGDGEGDPIEPGVDRPDKCHLGLRPFFSILGCPR